MWPLLANIVSWLVLLFGLIVVFLICVVILFVVIDEMGKAYANYKESRS